MTSLATSRTMSLPSLLTLNSGYQFTVATGRDYWLHWETPARIDPLGFK